MRKTNPKWFSIYDQFHNPINWDQMKTLSKWTVNKRKHCRQGRELIVLFLSYGVKSVPLHFGQGGKVSVWSSNTTDWPHFLQIYVPFPGFSPVVDIVHSYIRKLVGRSGITFYTENNIPERRLSLSIKLYNKYGFLLKNSSELTLIKLSSIQNL